VAVPESAVAFFHVVARQGDQMSFLKKSTKIKRQTHFVKIFGNFFSMGKKFAQNLSFYCDIEKKLPQLGNRPKGENSPSLVTLLGEHIMQSGLRLCMKKRIYHPKCPRVARVNFRGEFRLNDLRAGLPDLFWYNIPKREKYTKLPQNMYTKSP
jgi:hypothetical protein